MRSPAVYANVHPFVDSGRRTVGPSGRSYAVCETCGGKRIGTAHGRVEQRAPTMNPAVRARAERRVTELPPPTPPRPVALAPRPEPPKPAAPRVADWRLSLLRLALDQALAGPHLEEVTRYKLEDARRALRSELHGQVAVAEAAIGPAIVTRLELEQPAPEPKPERARARADPGTHRPHGASVPIRQAPRALPPRRPRRMATGLHGRESRPARGTGRRRHDLEPDEQRLRARLAQRSSDRPPRRARGRRSVTGSARPGVLPTALADNRGASRLGAEPDPTVHHFARLDWCTSGVRAASADRTIERFVHDFGRGGGIRTLDHQSPSPARRARIRPIRAQARC
jgi:hypothetical protein